MNDSLVKQLGELFSREDKKSIPLFSGNWDTMVTDWFKEAERVAKNNSWDDAQKLRFFSDRLKGEALDWHLEYIEQNPYLNDFDDWKTTLISRFAMNLT